CVMSGARSTYIHTHTHTHTPIHSTCIYTKKHTHTHTHTHACKPMYPCTNWRKGVAPCAIVCLSERVPLLVHFHYGVKPCFLGKRLRLLCFHLRGWTRAVAQTTSV